MNARSIRQETECLAARVQNYLPIPDIYSLEDENGKVLKYIGGADLGAENYLLSALPETRALGFLIENAALLNLPEAFLKMALFVKHRHTSSVGNHVILGLRYYGAEVEEHGFVVHLDNENHIVMVACHYDEQIVAKLEVAREQHGTSKRDYTIGELENAMRKLKQKLGTSANKKLDLKLTQIEEGWLPIRSRIAGSGKEIASPPYVQRKNQTKDQVWFRGLKIKAYATPSVSLTIYAKLQPRGKGWELYIAEQFSTSARAAYAIAPGTVLRNSFVPTSENDEVKTETAYGVDAKINKVILRDLVSVGEFSGRYARVKDELSDPPTDFFVLSDFDVSSSLGSTLIDRMMAYFYTDRIQRYVRELGLDVLDTYPELNPLNVVLESKAAPNENSYDSTGKKVHIARLHSDLYATCAREPRVLYHETIHAVTDALARLNRGNADNEAEIRDDGDGTPQLQATDELQASALDEGYADYFAASLMAQDAPDARPLYYKLMSNATPTSTDLLHRVKTIRRLDDADSIDKFFAPLRDPTKIDATTRYEWGILWSQFLWRLRSSLGAQIADRIIAHSILFLTRWATFSQAVMGLVTADYLLFGQKSKQLADETQDGSQPLIFRGAHELEIYQVLADIDQKKKLWRDWNIAKPAAGSQDELKGDNEIASKMKKEKTYIDAK